MKILTKLKKLAIFLVLSSVIVSGTVFQNSIFAGNSKAVNVKAPKNIIVMISDGCGYNEIKATNMYQYGKEVAQKYEYFPVKVAMTTYSNDSKQKNGYDPIKAWSDFEYLKLDPTDSAAAATAMSTGIKTYNAGLGVDKDKKVVKHLSERAKELGKSIGVISTVQFSHATPAGFSIHNPSRKDYRGIANQMLSDSKLDVIMGAGHPIYDKNSELSKKPEYMYVGGKETWEKLVSGNLKTTDVDNDGKSDPWSLIETKKDFENLTIGNTPKRVVGVAPVSETLQQGRNGDDKANPFAVPLTANVPTLEVMSKGALNVLDNNKNGFFLMIEGGAIDWAGHANQPGRLIEEEISFNKSVESVINWVEKSSSWEDTLLIVTGDHETGYLTGTTGKNDDLTNNGVNKLPGMNFNSGDHTNSLVPLFAKGKLSETILKFAKKEDLKRGKYIDNTEIAKTLVSILNLTPIDNAKPETPKNNNQTNTKNNTSTKGKAQVSQLPATGEESPVTFYIMGISIILIGFIILGISLITRKKKDKI